ncbi:hypothetical protein ACFP1I_30885 [Dyadobacter subterraneus]|uniref:Pentapeptide MXKDX repeat protein n=1 Tax=Dyadobacter subterraneus TaxID=2773304 RepID=A0ABR9W9C6_9BACT|nr:hypothetical protein [Dyadobacter subterraneus]MBE9461724.1 hypothetical protein [Dyadobacter subterraneus]
METLKSKVLSFIVISAIATFSITVQAAPGSFSIQDSTKMDKKMSKMSHKKDDKMGKMEGKMGKMNDKMEKKSKMSKKDSTIKK